MMKRFPIFLNETTIQQVQKLLATASEAQKGKALLPPDLQDDPLVSHRTPTLIYIGAIAFVVLIVAIVGAVSKRVEHAIVAALASSLVLIGFFLLLSHS